MVSPSWTIEEFLNELGSAKSVPGGGSAAALAGSLGIELGSKVCRVLLARRNLSLGSQSRLKRTLKTVDQLSRKLRRLIREDAQAYLGLVRALKAKRGILAAKKRAIQSPMKICEAASQGVSILGELRPFAGSSLGSDLKAGQVLLRGAFEAARMMVEINLK